MMEFSRIAEIYDKIEATSSRLGMTDILMELLKIVPEDEIARVMYLTQGRLYPDFIGIELGMSEKLAMDAISQTTGASEEKIVESLRKKGDLGTATAGLLSEKKQKTLFAAPLDLRRVYDNLDKIARATGPKSQDIKIKLLSELLHDAKPVEGKYIIRAVTGNLRLGIADMTILDALARLQAVKEEKDEKRIKEVQKEYRQRIERAYNMYPDMGHIAEVLAVEGVQGLEKIKIKIGVPIRAMLAERLASIEEIIEKIGRCAWEYKYDGLRIAGHISSGICKLFSRRLEDITDQFPDVCNALKKSFKGKECIVEGECVAVNAETGEMLPFQEISHRRGRKYGVETEKFLTLLGEERARIKGGFDITKEYPVTTFLFDCLYLDGKDLTDQPYIKRREALKEYFFPDQGLRISDSFISSDIGRIDAYFQQAIQDGCEGLVAKALDSSYQAGARGFQWIKYKRDYKSELADTVDLVVVGAFAGHGSRSGLYGSLLMAAFNPERGKFETISKLGTGFTDDVLAEMPKKFAPYLSRSKPNDVESTIKPDFWINPHFVMEIRGAELTLSPVHTCAYGVIRAGSGIAIRFPRFTGRWREDKKPEDATATKEIIEMYKAQLKKLE